MACAFRRRAAPTEITLLDVLRWYPGLIRVIAPQPCAGMLMRPVSWVASIRVTEPVLPSLRGNEIIVAPSHVLQELHEERIAAWQDVVQLADERGAAAVLVDAEPENGEFPGVPLLIAPAGFVAEAEFAVNREITERRSDLYRLGGSFARIHAAAPSARGLEHYFTALEAAAGLPLMLLSASGAAIARSRSAPRRLPASVLEAVAHDREEDIGIAGVQAGLEWLVHPVRSRGLPLGAALAAGIKPQASTEVARLVLRQLADSIRALYDQDASTAVDQRAERAAFIRDLLLGRGQLGDPLVRLQLSNLHFTPPLRVALLSSTQGGHRQSLDMPRVAAATRIDGETAIILNATTDGALDRLRALVARDDGRLVVSEPVAGVGELPAAYRQARLFSRLAAAGAVPGPVVDVANPLEAGIYGVIQGIADPGYHEPDDAARERLSRLVDAVLGPLLAYDGERGGELITSLEAYLASGGSVTGAADRLGVHRNTLSYRLNRIEDLLGRDLSDSQIRFLLQFVLAARQVERAAGD